MVEIGATTPKRENRDESQTVSVKTSDGKLIKLPLYLAEYSKTIKNLLDDGNEEEEILLPSISEKTMNKIIEYLHYLKDNPEPTISKPITTGDIHDFTEQWYANFIDIEDHLFVFDIITATNFLDIKSLLDLGCAKIATLIKVREAPAIRELFGIENDFTPEEEKKIIEENDWAQQNF